MNIQINPTTKAVLTILGVGGIITVSLIAPQMPIAFDFISKQWKKYKRRELGQIIKRLIKQEVVSITEKNGEVTVNLTEKGKARLLKYDFENIEIKAKKRDGLFRVVVFDIPENFKKNREIFRKKLIELGFKRFQDSVFVSAFPCQNEIDFLCHYLQISKFVTLFSVNKIERGEELVFKKVGVYD